MINIIKDPITYQITCTNELCKCRFSYNLSDTAIRTIGEKNRYIACPNCQTFLLMDYVVYDYHEEKTNAHKKACEEFKKS